MMAAHSRLFSPETLYAEGADPVAGVEPPARTFPFARDEKGSTPRDPFAFFDWLFSDAKARWGMRMYEQDWTATIYRCIYKFTACMLPQPLKRDYSSGFA